MDSLTETQWNEVARRYDALDSAAGDVARAAAVSAAWSAARDAAWSAAWYASRAAAVSASRAAAGYASRAAAVSAAWYAAGYATYELIGMHTLLNDGENLLFVPLFDFTGNYELQSLDVKEIETRIQRINDFIGPKVEVENDVNMTAEVLECFIEDIELFD
jgi:hypothetical protein